MKKDEKYILELVNKYTNEYVGEPIVQAMKNGYIDVFLRVGNVLLLLAVIKDSSIPCSHEINKLSFQNVTEDDISRLGKLACKDQWDENDGSYFGKILSKTCDKKCLLPFIYRQLNWICISILAAQYLSSIIIMRSSLELLINLATPDRSSGMKKRIESLTYLSNSEHKQIYRLWEILCSWDHPYEKWLKNICTTYMMHKPLHHMGYFEECASLFDKMLDVYCIIAIEHFHLNIENNIKQKEHSALKLDNYPFLTSRIS